MARISLKTIAQNIQQGVWPYIISVAHLLIGSIWVYYSPRSIIAFLVLLSSFGSLYYFRTSVRFKFLVGAALALLIMPVLGVRNIFYLEVIFQISVFSALALGLNIVVGFAGLLDLGYVAFYAVGAYLWAFFGSQQYYVLPFAPGTQPAHLPFLLPGDMFYLFIFLAVIAAAITGILLGLPVLRVRGDYLAIVTLGFGELIRVMANNLDKPLNFTNGPQGITPIQRPTLPPFIVDGFNAVFGRLVGHPADVASVYNVMFYLLALLVILIIVIVTRRLEDSKIGRAWAAIREDETAAIAMGVPLVKMKLAAFAAGASFAGAMGCLLAASQALGLGEPVEGFYWKLFQAEARAVPSLLGTASLRDLIEQLAFTPFVYENVGELIRQSDERLYLFSSDYPHNEGGRQPLARFEASLAGCDEQAKARFYSQNFARLFEAA